MDGSYNHKLSEIQTAKPNLPKGPPSWTLLRLKRFVYIFGLVRFYVCSFCREIIFVVFLHRSRRAFQGFVVGGFF